MNKGQELGINKGIGYHQILWFINQAESHSIAVEAGTVFINWTKVGGTSLIACSVYRYCEDGFASCREYWANLYCGEKVEAHTCQKSKFQEPSTTHADIQQLLSQTDSL